MVNAEFVDALASDAAVPGGGGGAGQPADFRDGGLF